MRPELNISIPRRLEIDPPANTGPSKFPSVIDQLKVIEYSSVPAGGQLEKDLGRYYSIMANVAQNTASEQDYVALKEIMLRVRNYVLTEDDFNLMADAVRTTQTYLKTSMEAADGNYELISVVAEQFVNQVNEWSEWLERELAKIAVNKNWGAPVIYGANRPDPSAIGYLWINNSLPDSYIAPLMTFDPDEDLSDYFN